METEFFDINDVVFFRFNNRTHFINHLNYLLRTDADQKWTNQNTSDNYVIVSSLSGDNKIYDSFLPNSKDSRNEIKNKLLSEIKKINIKNMLFARIECPYENVYWHTDGVFEEAMDILDVFKQVIIEDKNFHILVFISHPDQHKNYTHFHVLGYID